MLFYFFMMWVGFEVVVKWLHVGFSLELACLLFCGIAVVKGLSVLNDALIAVVSWESF